MEHALAEMPLALFSTFAPLGAGAFITLAAAFLSGALDTSRSISAGDTSAQDNSRKALRRLDVLTVIPLILVMLGFVAAFFHLATPGNAFNVINGIGRSPLSNEIAVGVVFFAAALVYWVVALTGKPGMAVRKILTTIVALLAIVFAIFIGSAYMVSTITTWNSILAPVALAGYALLGGGLFGLLIIQSAGTKSGASRKGFGILVIILSVIGAAAAITGVAGQFMIAGEISAITNTVAEMQAWLIAFIIGVIVALLASVLSVTRKPALGIVSLGCIVALVTVFVGRVIFYALYVNVGL
jgi:anaerobic dimethyl sulfoxide reductase subunit C (anchor subunit)/Tat-targeted selenate reductase subunit YnfH